MSEWDDEGILLDKIKYSDFDGVVSFFSKNHGYVKSFCKECFTKKNLSTFQKGNLLHIYYYAKSDNSVGNIRCSLFQNYSNKIFNDLIRLNVINSVCSLLSLLPEKEVNTNFYLKTKFLFTSLADKNFLKEYSFWELDFLFALGFGLDFSKCAFTETVENLEFVSPKSGRAISKNAALPWKNKLLELPSFLIDKKINPSLFEIKKALYLTGFFLENHVSKTLNYTVPNARNLLINSILEVTDV